MKNVQAMRADPSLLKKGEVDGHFSEGSSDRLSEEDVIEKGEAKDTPAVVKSGPAPKQDWETLRYFSEWRHAKLLLGTAGSWFLVDVSLRSSCSATCVSSLVR